MADYRKSLMDMTPEERADVAPGFVPSDDVSTPLSVKVADAAVSLTTPIDSIVEIQEELAKENPDYLKVGMLGGIEAISLLAPGAGKAAQSMIRKGADMARQTDNVVDVTSNVPKVSRQVSNTDYDTRVASLDEAEDAVSWQKNAESLVKELRETSPTIRTPELEESAQALRDQRITREQHLENVNTYKPVESWDALPREPSNKATVFSLKPDQREKGRFILPADTTDSLGVTQSGLKVGDRFNGRLDIPAYQRFDTWIVAGTSNAEKGVTHYAKAIHYKGVGDKPVRFAASQKTGEKIGTGEMGKTGYATVSGEIKDLDADAIREKAATLLNDPEWTQVGFDPRRQSSFYVRGENNRHVPVREADEVIQIGPLVLAKNAKLDMEYSGYNEGGMAMDEQMDAVFKSSRTGYAEGGEVGAAPDTTIGVDPVSGNEVPMGATPEEVRDDIPAQLSEGEYVVPADVVRFYGVKFFEDLRTEAKQGYAEMDQNGRIGGEPVGPEGMEMIEPEDDLPFDISELQVVDEETGMYVGGLTGYAEGGEVEAAPIPQNPFSNTGSTAGYEIKEYVNDAGEVMYIQFMNGEPMTFIPQGFRPKESVAEQAATGAGVAATSAPTTASMSAPSGSGSSGGSDGSIGSTGMGDVDAAFTQGASAKDWTKASVEDFASATSNLGSGTRLGSTIAGAINPLLGVATGIGMGSESRNNAYDMLDGIAYQLESGNLSEGQRTSLLDQQAKIQEYLKPSSKDDSPATTLLKGSGIFGGQTSLYENLGDFSNDGRATFADTWLGDLLGADGTAGVQGPSLSESLDGARRTGEPVYEGDAKKSTQVSEPTKYQKQMASGDYGGAAKTATNSWIAATNAANSIKDKSSPAFHAAIKAQSEASKAATAAKQKETGWTGFFSPPKDKDDDE